MRTRSRLSTFQLVSFLVLKMYRSRVRALPESVTKNRERIGKTGRRNEMSLTKQI